MDHLESTLLLSWSFLVTKLNQDQDLIIWWRHSRMWLILTDLLWRTDPVLLVDFSPRPWRQIGYPQPNFFPRTLNPSLSTLTRELRRLNGSSSRGPLLHQAPHQQCTKSGMMRWLLLGDNGYWPTWIGSPMYCLAETRAMQMRRTTNVAR